MSKRTVIKAYYGGLREGVTRYSWWRDGVQYVGTTGETLRDALLKIELEENERLEALEDRREIKQKLGYSRVGLNNV